MMAAENKTSRRREILRSADFFAGQIKSTIQRIDFNRHARATSSGDFRASYDDPCAHYLHKIGRRLSASTYRPNFNSMEQNPAELSTKSILELHTLKANGKQGASHQRPATAPHTLDNALLDTLATSKTWPGRELMAQPSDLVCFLAGCSPGRSQCGHHYETPNPSTHQIDGAAEGGSSHTVDPASRNSTVSFDQFPLATLWLNTQQPVPASAANITIATNFSLPGPKVVPHRKASLAVALSGAESTEPATVKRSSEAPPGSALKDQNQIVPQAVRETFVPDTKQKPASALERSNSPSMLSKMSRTSAFRHALLKSSVSESPIDFGLPIPPVLTPGMVSSEFSRTQKEPTLPSDWRSPESQAQEPESIPKITVQPSASAQDIPLSSSSSSPSNDSRADYWGFKPAINEAVQGAVDAAVKTIVSEGITKGGEVDKKKVAKAYRRAVAESLTRAAVDADTFLRRPSLWKDPEALHAHQDFLKQPCHRVTCLEDPSIERCNTFSCSPIASPTGTKPALTWRANDCAVCIHPSDQDLSRTHMETGGHLGLPGALVASHSFPSAQVDTVPERVVNESNGIGNPANKSAHAISHTSLSLVSHRSDRATGSASSGEFEEITPQEQQANQSLLPQPTADDADQQPLSNLFIRDPTKRRNTVKWLRDLLSQNGAYESQLTALPPRKRRGQDSTTLPTKTQYISVLPEGQSIELRATNSKIGIKNQNKDVSLPEGLSKTINEIEEILKGALEPGLNHHEDHYQKIDNYSGDSDRRSSIDSVHESVSTCSLSTASADDAVMESPIELTFRPKKSPLARPSGWRPTGRVHTSFPPGTQPQSTDSFPLHIPELEPLSPSASTLAKEFSHIGFHNLKPFHQSHPNIPNRTISSISPGQSIRRATTSRTDAQRSRKSQSPRATVPIPRLSIRDAAERCDYGHSEDEHQNVKDKLQANSVPSKVEVLQHVMRYRQPQVNAPGSSHKLRAMTENHDTHPRSKDKVHEETWHSNQNSTSPEISSKGRSDQLRQMSIAYSHSLDGTQWTQSDELDFNQGFGHREAAAKGQSSVKRTGTGALREDGNDIELRDVPNLESPVNTGSNRNRPHLLNLKNKRHVSLADHRGFSLARSHKRQTIARDWSPGRKRFCAAVACISTALVGILVGIYAGETPAIQYWIVDFHHYTVLGNVFFFIGLSIPTFLFWPLPLLHGRKPYILGAMSLAMPLLFPQALAVGQIRSPYTHIWRTALIFPRAMMGLCLGFANMNFKGILTDLFGASLQSTNPHQEHVDEFDVRRHGGGMGVWLGLWTWSAMGSIGVGFLIGAATINTLNPAWGFYISITIIAFVLLLNVLTPEVRRSAFRRSVAEVKNGDDVSRRLARGEVKMHMVQTGPKWWGEEFHYGVKLSVKMLKQPGFMVMAAYVAWMYGQIVLIVLLLGALCSNTYRFKSHLVGLAVSSVPLGALLAVPFQKASLFSRDRSHAPLNDDDTYKRKVKWSSHMLRRAIFVLLLPFAGLGYTLSSGGPQIHFIVPILFAALIGFLSNLAMAECHGIIMETYDTSDLQPGMTGRSRGGGRKSANKRTNYSSFPRVSAAFGITQGLGYLLAALASGMSGALTRNLGQQAATGVMAFILLILSILLLGVLIRFKEVKIIPDSKKEEMNQYHRARQSMVRTNSGGEIEPWRPIIIGNPHHSTRRMCILELGSLSRFSEIRLKNRLIDEQSLEARHPNQQMMLDVRQKIKEKEEEVLHQVKTSISRHSSLRSVFSDESRRVAPEKGDLGGFVEVDISKGPRGRSERGKGKRKEREMHSAKGSVQRRATGIEE